MFFALFHARLERYADCYKMTHLCRRMVHWLTTFEDDKSNRLTRDDFALTSSKASHPDTLEPVVSLMFQ